MFSTMRGVSVQLAPSGAAGRSIDQSLGNSPGVYMVKEIIDPSGDHMAFMGVSGTLVIGETAPSSSIQRTKSWVPSGSLVAENRMRVPSGDQRGEEPSTRNRLRVPSAFMSHRPESQRSSIWLTQLLV